MKKRILVIALSLFLGMLLVSCVKHESTPPVTESAGIEGVQWYLTEVAGSPVSLMANDKQPHIMLNPAKKQATGFSGCNNFFGSYELNGSLLKFGPLGATSMACPDLETGLETEVFKALDQTRTWEIRGGELLFLDDGKILARFTKENVQRLSGPVWQWVRTLYNDDRKFEPADPKNYTVQFQEDGTLSIKADCNQKGGAFSVFPAERTVSIEITHSTMAFCPEGSLEDEFVKGLGAAAIYFIKEGDLSIDLKYDSGTMRFSKQQGK
jgi:heat shock protein HslJ